MATEIEPTIERPSGVQPAWTPYRLSVRQFLAMIDAGIFPDDARVELLGGVLVQMMAMGDPRDYTLTLISEELRRLTPEGWFRREDKSLQLNTRTRLVPDVAIVRGPFQQFSERTPHARETALVVEVSFSSDSYDRGEKWRAYAAARIPIYWIVNLSKNQIEVYSNPIGRGKQACYREVLIHGIEDLIPVVIMGEEVGRFAIKDIMP